MHVNHKWGYREDDPVEWRKRLVRAGVARTAVTGANQEWAWTLCMAQRKAKGSFGC